MATALRSNTRFMRSFSSDPAKTKHLEQFIRIQLEQNRAVLQNDPFGAHLRASGDLAALDDQLVFRRRVEQAADAARLAAPAVSAWPDVTSGN